jgi:hypothetical protein
VSAMYVKLSRPNSNMERELFNRRPFEEYAVQFPSPCADWETVQRYASRWEDLVPCQDSRGLLWWFRVESIEPVPEP